MTTCPTCGCKSYEIDSNAPTFDVARFACGYAVALHGEASGGRIGAVDRCRSWRLRERVSRFWPSAETWATAGVRASVGGALLMTEHMVSSAVQPWWHFCGKFFCVMAAWSLLGHAERQFTTHVRVALQRGWKMARGT